MLRKEPPVHPTVGSVWSPPPSTPSILPNITASDVRDDDTTQLVWNVMKELAKERSQEAMVVLTQLTFDKYLAVTDPPINAPAGAMLPRPSTHVDPDLRRGDFDLLIIHRQYGFIVGEVKSVGAVHTENLTKAILSRVKKALRQLIKAEEVLKHVVSDLKVPLQVIKTLIFPYVTSQQLTLAMGNADPEVQQVIKDQRGNERMG